MFDEFGRRKYINRNERDNMFIICKTLDIEKAIFCMVMLETGCRISEALNIKACHIDIKNMSITLETLKKRKKGCFRTIPVSNNLIKKIDKKFEISNGTIHYNDNLWNWSRMTAYRNVMSAIRLANIDGPQAMPKGLRHGFAVAALEADVPITLVQKWMGHADLRTTAIYTEVLGEEERRIASRMWRRRKPIELDNF